MTNGINISIDFVLAGNATFTVENPKGEHYTYRVRAKEFSGNAVENTAEPATLFFASLLTGPDNESDYTYIGRVVPVPFNAPVVKLTAKSRLTIESKPVAVLNWALQVLAGKRGLPAGYRIRHEGRCGRCGRTLTVPESLDHGIGPECYAKIHGSKEVA